MPGTYYIVFAMEGSYNYAQIMSGTHPGWSANWSNGVNVARLSASDLELARAQGCIPKWHWYGDGRYGLYGIAMAAVKVVVGGVPITPLGVTATDGTYLDRVVVTWSTVSNATRYAVYRNTIDIPDTAANLSGGIPTTSYDDTTATPEQTYWYWVRAGNSNGWSSLSSSDSGFAAPEPMAGTALVFLALLRWFRRQDADSIQDCRDRKTGIARAKDTSQRP